MKKISTRQVAQSSDAERLRLIALLEDTMKRLIGMTALDTTALQSLDETIDLTEKVVQRLVISILDFRKENLRLENEIIRLNVDLDQCLADLSSISNVAYDAALDSAVQELMMTSESLGIGFTTPDGELKFNVQDAFSKAELKPILAHLIDHWVNEKIKNLP